MSIDEDAIYDDLTFIYGSDCAQKILPEFQSRLIRLAKAAGHRVPHQLDEHDVILITYGDICTPDTGTRLEGLYHFAHRYIKDAISTMHILPFYPYSSDDGFSVIDYLQVDPNLGSWSDVEQIGSEYHLMFDLVANHISRESPWFVKYQKGIAPYDRFFIEVDPKTDLSEVFRPRALPLLTEVDTHAGKTHVWTTFSDDQIDLNYAEPAVLLHVIDVLIEYISHGARLIRLDAVAFIWKELGTPCIHHPKTHRIIKLMRHLLDAAETGVLLITETNVPHKENISYFGNGTDEAAMVYNFPLPPLTLYAFMKGDATVLSTWAGSLEFPTPEITYFNFLASHDGIGLMPTHGLLPESEIELIAEKTKALGGFVSRKSNPDGSTSPYELNINFLDALAIAGTTDDRTTIVNRFIASQSIMLTLRGVPGIYFHSLIGSRNWSEGAQRTGQSRSINREKLTMDTLIKNLDDTHSLQHQILIRYKQLLYARKSSKAFAPAAEQHILPSPDKALYMIVRTACDHDEFVLCITNVSDRVSTPIDIMHILTECPELHRPEKLTSLTDRSWVISSKIRIQPYEVVWIQGQCRD